MNYKVILHNNRKQLRQEPEMEEPKMSKCGYTRAKYEMDAANEEYYQHRIASLPIIDIADEFQSKWEVGQMIEDSEFEVKERCFGITGDFCITYAIPKQKDNRKNNEALIRLLEMANVPKILIEHPTLLFGKPTEKDIEWAKAEMEKYHAKQPLLEQEKLEQWKDFEAKEQPQEKESDRFENIISIGFKNGEADFGIRATVTELSFKQMNELRSMLIVAIGAMEDMWRRAVTEDTKTAIEHITKK